MVVDKAQIKKIVYGQLKHVRNIHPEFFSKQGKQCLKSIEKRISGDVFAYIKRMESNNGKSVLDS